VKYDSPEAARWADVVATEFDPSQRETAVRNLIQVWMDDVPFVMVYQPQQLVALSTDVRDFVYDPILFANFSSVSK
jgi:ABC-type transport system substrate-binding protein